MALKRHSNLWQLTHGERMRYFGAVLAMGMTNLCIFAAPFIGGYAIDVVVNDDFAFGQPWLVAATEALFGTATHTTYLWLSAFAALALTAVGGCFLYVRGRFAAVASEHIARGLRELLFERLHHAEARFYDSADTGDLVQRCSSDVETVRVFLASDVIEIGRALMLLVCVMPFLFTKDARFAGLAVCLMPLLAIGAYVFFTKVKQVFTVTDEAEAAMTATLQENLTGIRVVRAFARQQFETAKFAERNAQFRDHNYRLIRMMGIYWASSDLVAMFQIGIVLFAGALFIQRGTLTPGDLFAILTSVSMVIWPVRQLGRVITDSGKAVVSLGRINDVLNEPRESEELAPVDGRARGEITFEDIVFAYGPDREPVLDGVSLHVRS
jgi:ATP-binding cassette subfamily B protein